MTYRNVMHFTLSLPILFASSVWAQEADPVETYRRQSDEFLTRLVIGRTTVDDAWATDAYYPPVISPARYGAIGMGETRRIYMEAIDPLMSPAHPRSVPVPSAAPYELHVEPRPEWASRTVGVLRVELEPIPPHGWALWRQEAPARREAYLVFSCEPGNVPVLLYYVLPVPAGDLEHAAVWSPETVARDHGKDYERLELRYVLKGSPDRRFTAYRFETRGITFVVDAESGKLVARTVWK